MSDGLCGRLIFVLCFRASIPYIDQSPQEAAPPDYKLQYAENRLDRIIQACRDGRRFFSIIAAQQR
jgi:hypothetical protein